MLFTKEDKILIEVLRQENGYGAKKFPNRNWSLSSLNNLLKKIDQTDGGKTRKTRTVQNVDAVEELVLSQENVLGTHRRVHQIL